MRFAKDSGLRDSLIESDSIMTVRAVNDSCCIAADFPILNDIQILMRKINGGLCSHISLCGNIVVHTLVKLFSSSVEDQF